MRTAQQLRQDRDAVMAEARDLRTQIEQADAPSDDLTARFNEKMARVDELASLISNAEAMEARFAALDSYRPGEVEPRTGSPLPHTDPANRRHSFSVLKAMSEAARGNLTGLELEVAQEMARRSGRSVDFNSFVLPYDLAFRGETRDLTVSNSSGAIPKGIAPQLIDFLRARLILTDLGATFLPDLVGDFAIPKKTAASSAGWAAEGTAFGESSPTIGQVLFQPKRVGTFVEYSRTVLKQTSLAVESYVQNDIVSAIAQAIDLAAINGSGSGANPEGILQNSSITTVAIGATGGAPTLATVIGLEKAVDTGNALAGSLAYVTSPAGRGKLKSVARASNTDSFLWDYQTNMVNGYRAVSTGLVPIDLTKSTGEDLTALVFGNWSAVHVGLWGGAIITVNPYSLDTAGMVRLTVEQLADIKLRHVESFSRCVDMDPA